MDTLFPDDENGDALRNMAHAGDDLSKERDIDFSVVFSSEQSATKFCQMMAERAIKVNLHVDGDEI